MKPLWKTAGALALGLWRKMSAWQRSSRLTAWRTPLVLPDRTVREIEAAFAERNERQSRAETGGADNAENEEMIERIRKETDVWNVNNVTRTQAYWNMYTGFPELHWALLAHLVSRNGGWSMTDLKGQWLPELLNAEAAEANFEMLETCNALIFRDAYPQLRLYAESRRLNQPQFRLLPRFGVSAFMQPFWECFWENGNSVLLSVALIVNEQHVIHGPVVKNRFFRNRVFEALPFQSLPLLQTNQIVFPLFTQGRQREHLAPLAGRVLERFESLDERIEFGKSLYGMLFGYPRVLDGAKNFAASVPHTGSRADYWPERFCVSKQKTGEKSQGRELSAGSCWYSPPLEAAWGGRSLPEAVPRDWFADRTVLSYVSPPKPPLIVDMTYEHLLGQRKWQAAALLSGQ